MVSHYMKSGIQLCNILAQAELEDSGAERRSHWPTAKKAVYEITLSPFIILIHTHERAGDK